ncbi:uncharacterized protein LOC104904316 isoform X2 [Beta vulgaris subsp. vulgaris]|uniref:uncharacterized protein LOC104904316 isoform X2 n=1 Tax=Beta vulgaris subsp. vulgaris TaxID=3555 RepID=UPI002036C94F|nr:uncharacterized protein LOC104904316 isoform X2 [Beta vulgaris subsp. vulgaris]
MNMASLPLTKLVLLFIIISASLISTSYAGRFLTKSLADEEFVGTYEVKDTSWRLCKKKWKLYFETEYNILELKGRIHFGIFVAIEGFSSRRR